jgi:hypothetical protein
MPLSGIRTHDPRVRLDENMSCLRLRGHCDRLYPYNLFINKGPRYEETQTILYEMISIQLSATRTILSYVAETRAEVT